MRTCLGSVALALIGLFAGCSPSPIPESQVVIRVGPHQGAIARLPDEKGLVELVNEPEQRDRRSTEPTSLVAYFLRTDGKSPLDQPPSDVNIVVEAGRTASQTVQLSLEPKTDDPSGGARFASKPGQYQVAGLRGTLNAKIGGQQVSTPVSGGR
ncbi:MAG: hypothetical protein ACLQIB_18570 [Isosphaeraceae bacterium]